MSNNKNSLFDTDRLYKSYFKLALPLALGMMVSLVYSLVDTYFVALTNNTNLIAGVSLCTPLFNALMAFGNIFGQGGSSLISRMLGYGDTDGTHRVSSFCFYMAVVVGVILSFVTLVFKTPVLGFLGATSETFSYASDYYTALAAASPIIVLNFVHSNLMRCEGKSTEAMISTVTGAVINIILDPIFIFGLNMGAFGAAFATVIGYFFSDVYSFFVVTRKCKSISVKPKDSRIGKTELGSILGIGFTAALSNLMSSLTMAINNRYLLPYGNDKIAALGITFKVCMIPTMIITGLAFGGIPLFGYLYGGADRKNLGKLLKFCMRFLCGISLAISAVVFIFSDQFIALFLSDGDLISTGSQMLRYQISTTVFISVVLLLTVVFQAVGKVVPAFILSISRQGVVFLAVIVVLAKLLGYEGVIMSQPVADLLSAAIAIIMFVIFNPTKKKENN